MQLNFVFRLEKNPTEILGMAKTTCSDDCLFLCKILRPFINLVNEFDQRIDITKSPIK